LGFGVSESYRQRGTGFKLVMTAVERARQEGLQRLESDFFANNEAAIALLQKAGFNEEGLRKGAILKQGKLRDICSFGLLL
jgi:RimJ/RimL family protein N-acetyltransferase